MHKYTIPSLAAYHKRTLFHSIERSPSEANDEWYNRILEVLQGCEYGEFTDFIVIDKFISGLDYETFLKYAGRTTLTIDDVHSIGLDDRDGCKIDYDTTVNVEVKLEDDDDNSRVHLHRDLQIGNTIIVPEEKLDVDVIAKSPISLIQSKPPLADRNIEGVGRNNDSSLGILDSNINEFQRESQSKKTVCSDCGKNFEHKNSCNCHKRHHTGNDLYHCDVCGKRFVKESQLKAHMPTHNQDKFSFLECYLCGSKFDRIHGLRIHFTISHTMRRRRDLRCSMCSKTFFKQNDLDLHIKVHRGLVKGHSCPHCDKIFDRSSGLREHMTVHSNTKEFVCETCGFATKTNNMLRKHAHSHNSDRRFKCCECDQVLKSAASLKSHMRQHTGERPFTCSICEKTFITYPSLSKHLKVHRQEKPAQCQICSKRFATTYHLKVHSVVHTKEKPYSCTQCDRAFTQVGTLKAHQLKAHTAN